MNLDVEDLSEREKARIRARDRRLRGPKVIVDNAGLRKVQLDLELRRRARRVSSTTLARSLSG